MHHLTGKMQKKQGELNYKPGFRTGNQNPQAFSLYLSAK
jgi:hypothetical protein